jgi:hypothetical protein
MQFVQAGWLMADSSWLGAQFWLRRSRFTDPGECSGLLAQLPHDPADIARMCSGLTVHHNLRTYYGIPPERWAALVRVWPPFADWILRALSATGPGDLTGYRKPEERVVGACMLESHLLACMLRYRGHPARIRAGYFRDVMTNSDHIVAFWRAHQWSKAVLAGTQDDPGSWQRDTDDFTRHQVEVDHHIEHWVCEYWDKAMGCWTLLDANTDFLRAHSGIEVDVLLPRQYFQPAHEAWLAMRADESFDPDRYGEEPQDGRSHIRSQLLWDYLSMLNHDIAGTGDEPAPAGFVKQRRYSDAGPDELAELDALARLLSRSPSADELAGFYLRSTFLSQSGAHADPHSFVHATPLAGSAPA